jgi:hypothetical protein
VDIHVADPQQRKTIQIQARRCFTRRRLIAFSDYHTSRGGVQARLNVLWRFRHDPYSPNLEGCPAPHCRTLLSATARRPAAG